MTAQATAPVWSEISSADTDLIATEGRNQKVLGAWCGKKKQDHTSTNSFLDIILDTDSACSKPSGKDLIAGVLAQCKEFTTAYDAIDLFKDMAKIYANTNIAHLLNLNKWHVRTYEDETSIQVLHSLSEMGNLLFSDSRQRNANESKHIDAFFKSKTKVISRRKL